MEDKNTLLENADSLYFSEVEDESGMAMELTDSLKSNLVGLIEDRYAGAETARESDERRWMQAYHNFRGLYPKNVKFRESEKSRVFIKVTKTKVLAAFGQLVDVIFGTGKFPIGVRETQIPELDLIPRPKIRQVQTPDLSLRLIPDPALKTTPKPPRTPGLPPFVPFFGGGGGMGGGKARPFARGTFAREIKRDIGELSLFGGKKKK